MIVTCPSCSSKYRINDEKIPGKGARISCPSCAHKFVVFRDAAPAAPAVAPSRGRNFAADDEDDADVPTTVMPHGSQLAKEIRAAADRARAEEGFEPSPPTPPPTRPVGDAAGARKLRQAGKTDKASGGAPPALVIGIVVLVVALVSWWTLFR